MILFLDACILIYRLEEVAPRNARVAARLATLREEYPDAGLAVSRLSVLECRIKPLREDDTELLARYGDFFASRDLCIVELDAHVIEGATRLRAGLGLRTPDALQAACCLSLGEPAVFVSNDARFERVPFHRLVLI
jgi:predicted nucleic acid-binding protein